LPRNYTVNVFCPRCHGLFFPRSTSQANIDGAYFGTTFPHLYLMTHPVSETTNSCMGSDVVISPQPCFSGHDTFEANTNLHSSGVRFQSKPTKFILQESRGRSSAPTNRDYPEAKSPFKAQTRPEMKGLPSKAIVRLRPSYVMRQCHSRYVEPAWLRISFKSKL
jgi:hypothetical protein